VNESERRLFGICGLQTRIKDLQNILSWITRHDYYSMFEAENKNDNDMLAV
jgi:hypothetical protein